MNFSDKSRDFSTGEFAALCHLNKKTLFYYDEIGLFRPAYVAENGYRRYTLLQIDRIALILCLRDLGMSLSEIREYLNVEDACRFDAMLLARRRELDEKLERLGAMRNMLERVRASSREFSEGLQEGFRVARFAERRYDVIDGAAPGGLTVINYLTDGLFTGRLFDGERLLNIRIAPEGALAIPAGDYLCHYYVAEHPNPLDQLARVRAYAASHGLALGRTFYQEVNELLFPRYHLCLRFPLR